MRLRRQIAKKLPYTVCTIADNVCRLMCTFPNDCRCVLVRLAVSAKISFSIAPHVQKTVCRQRIDLSVHQSSSMRCQLGTSASVHDVLYTFGDDTNLYNKRRYVCLSVCLYVSMFRMAGQTAGPIETKLDTRTHVHPGSVSGKVNVKVIHVCVRD